jgi:ribonuclease HII
MVVADPTLRLERRLLGQEPGLVIGCDEVGRGALAGPVAVGLCAVEVRRSTRVPKGLRDSKLLSEARREQLAPVAGEWGLAHAVGYASALEIDAMGITACLGLAGQRALTELIALGIDVQGATVLLDGHFDWLSRAVSTPLTVRTQIKADRDCASVAAASVISKVARDRIMIEHDGGFPGYGWARNKGYGSDEHRAAIVSLGATDLHRQTWLSGMMGSESSMMLDGFDELDAELSYPDTA